MGSIQKQVEHFAHQCTKFVANATSVPTMKPIIYFIEIDKPYMRTPFLIKSVMDVVLDGTLGLDCSIVTNCTLSIRVSPPRVRPLTLEIELKVRWLNAPSHAQNIKTFANKLHSRCVCKVHKIVTVGTIGRNSLTPEPTTCYERVSTSYSPLQKT